MYLERTIDALQEQGIAIEDESQIHLSPIGWERVSLSAAFLQTNSIVANSWPSESSRTRTICKPQKTVWNSAAR